MPGVSLHWRPPGARNGPDAPKTPTHAHISALRGRFQEWLQEVQKDAPMDLWLQAGLGGKDPTLQRRGFRPQNTSGSMLEWFGSSHSISGSDREFHHLLQIHQQCHRLGCRTWRKECRCPDVTFSTASGWDEPPLLGGLGRGLPSGLAERPSAWGFSLSWHHRFDR